MEETPGGHLHKHSRVLIGRGRKESERGKEVQLIFFAKVLDYLQQLQLTC